MSLGRPFCFLWGSNAASNLADGLAFVSIPLLAATLTDDPRWIAGISVVYAVVRLLVAVPVGAWVDQWDRRSIVVGAHLLRGVAVLALALAIQTGVAGLLFLYVVVAVIGTFETAADNAAVALVPSLVDTRRLDTANSRISAAQLVADDFAGPPLGGVLFAVAASAPFFAMGGLWAAAGALALALPRRPRDQAGAPARGRPVDAPPGARAVARDRGPVDVPARRPRAWADALAGAAWLRTHGLVAGLAGIGAVASVGYMLAFSILVVFARDRLDLDASGYGVVLAISAAGGLVASLVTPALRARLGYRWTIAASLLLGAVSLGLLAVTDHPVVAAVLLAGYIAHAVAWGICATSLRQRLVPSRLLGRVNAAVRFLSLLGLAVGAALGGLLADIDVALPVGVGGGVFLGAAVAALALFRPRR